MTIANLDLTLISQTTSTVTLGWFPPTGAQGYKFSANGKTSSTMNGAKNSVRFAKPGPYTVDALGIDSEMTTTVVKSTRKTDTLSWSAPAGCQGYKFDNNGKISSTMDGTRHTVTFAKPGPYHVYALDILAEGVYDASDPPVIVPPPTPSDWPGSYTNGPLGSNNILPVYGKCLLINNWGQPGKTWSDQQAAIASREAFIGRRFDGIHIQYWSGGSYLGVAGIDGADVNRHAEQWVHDRGQIVCVTWAPPMSIAQVNAGNADAVFGVAADLWKAMPFTVMLRPFWEFDGEAGFPWSCGNSADIGANFVTAWRRMVGIFQSHGASNVGFWWCPLEGSPDRPGINASYPGDAYVDWVGSDIYNGGDGNWNTPLHGGWASFEECTFYSPPIAGSQYSLRSPTKPFVIGELGCTKDATRQGDWYRAIPAVLATKPNMTGISFFDQDVSGLEGSTANWFVDSSPDAYAGFKTMALAML